MGQNPWENYFEVKNIGLNFFIVLKFFRFFIR